MKERQILFQGAMVRAIIDGSKSQTRRVIKRQPEYPIIIAGDPHTNRYQAEGCEPITEAGLLRECPYGQTGDRLWVRENFAPNVGDEMAFERWAFDRCGPAPEIHFAADGGDPHISRWRPSIHMPRWASRIELEIVSVRVERLNDCSAADARAEGLHRYPYDWRDCEFPLDDVAYEPFKGFGTRYSCASQAYRALWESINGAGSWDANPWVWVVEFSAVGAVQGGAT